LKTEENINEDINYLCHEYFHNYNVKRIRPFELGPFDYENGSKTNQLWISEGLTVYYEYIITRRAGLSDESTFLSEFEKNISDFEKKPGKSFQSLSQSSYNTWNDGPFGSSKTINCYGKGSILGLFFDLKIRNATNNAKSLDDVMRFLYFNYYKKLQRGFTEAEFQEACETIADIPLTEEFEYIYTTRDLDYKKYLNYAGLEITKNEAGRYKINRIENPQPLQSAILKSWLNE
jgi:predicted metalloprotease with PDZ domain